MNKHVMAIAVCLASQPVVSLGAETMTQPGVKERGSKQSFEIQRDRVVLEHLAKSCIPMRPGNPNGVASQEANKPGGVRNDCEPMTQPRAMPDGSRWVHTFPDSARVPGAVGRDVVSRYNRPDRTPSPIDSTLPVRPDPDPRTGRGVSARSGDLSTPGVVGQAREPEIDSHGSANRRQLPFLRDQRLPGMDYRRLPVRSVAECHTACSIESQCRSWEFRPAQRNNTFDNGDDGATCFLKSGIPQREYARGHVSGIKPPPPAVAAGAPPPPVVSR
jgi:hypothetical protein